MCEVDSHKFQLQGQTRVLLRSEPPRSLQAAFTSHLILKVEPMLTIRESMELAGTNLLHTLSPSFNYMPLWNVKIVRETMQARCKIA